MKLNVYPFFRSSKRKAHFLFLLIFVVMLDNPFAIAWLINLLFLNVNWLLWSSKFLSVKDSK